MNIVAIEGPTGVGKTTLATRLAERYGAPVLLDTASQVSLLHDYYAGEMSTDRRLRFEMQLCTRRIELWESAPSDESVVFADFSVMRALPFSQLTENPMITTSIRDEVERATASPPLLLVLLRATPDDLHLRVRRRARPAETELDVDGLRRLCDAFQLHRDDLLSGVHNVEIDTSALGNVRAPDDPPVDLVEAVAAVVDLVLARPAS